MNPGSSATEFGFLTIEVVSEGLGVREGRGVCNSLGSVLAQQKFEAMDRPALQPSDRPGLQLSFI